MNRLSLLLCALVVAVTLLATPMLLHAQNSSSLHGQVTDPSGAIVPGASVQLSGGGKSFSATSGGDGSYSFGTLPAGRYALDVNVTGFTPFSETDVLVVNGTSRMLNIPLTIATQEQQVEVTADTRQLDTEPESNANAVVITGKDLDALSDDPDEMESELTALAGPGAGNGGAQIYVDGFTGGQMPPKSAIREIRINQNPFSAEFDKLGYGRIEILTKPGTDKLHGQVEANGNTSAFNTTHFVTNPPSYYAYFLNGSIGGSISKKTSWFFSIFARNTQNLNIVNAPGTLDDPNYYADHSKTNFVQGVLNPQTRIYLSPRVDYQITPSNTLTIRYQLNRGNESGDGVGQLALASQANDEYFLENTLQISDSQIVNAHIVNDLRFQYQRDRDQQIAEDLSPTVVVQGTFTGGGSNDGESHTHGDHYEFQDYVTGSFKNHTLHFGTRLRAYRETDSANSGTNGAYTFSSLCNPITGTACTTDPANNAPGSFYSGIASLGTVTKVNNPNATSTLFDGALFLQDDWKINRKLTIDPGLRFETQNRIHDHANWGPRFALAYAIDGGKKRPPKTIVRAGYGWFFNRFTNASVIQAIHQNGQNQIQEVFSNPRYVAGQVPEGTGTLNPSSAVYSISPKLKAALDMQGAIGVDRTITKAITSNVTFLYSRGVHQYLSDNINAPIYDYTTNTFAPNPATGAPPLLPFPGEGNLYQFQSNGVYRQKQLITTISGRAKNFSLTGYYALSYFDSDASGVTYFPSRQYDIAFDYGRASNDIRNRVALFGQISLPYDIQASPLLVANSGQPFNITTGSDTNGDQQFNERPALVGASFCTAGQKRYFATQYGCLDSTPNLRNTNGQFNTNFVPVNSGRGPANVSMDLRLSKNFGIGPKLAGHGGGGGDGGGPHHGRGLSGGLTGNSMGGGGPHSNAVRRKYNLSFTVYARNVFNIVNLAQPNNVLTSPNFDQSLQLAGGFFQQRNASSVRSIYLQTNFRF
jgi:hypothetical protein